MQVLDLDSLLSQDQMMNEMKQKEQKYHQIFQQLSTVRSQFRRTKQELDLLKINYKGAEEQIQTLRDVIRQKKDIIHEMVEQIQEKTLHLNVLETQNNHILKQKQELEVKLQYQLEESAIYKGRIIEYENKQSIFDEQKQLMDKHCSIDKQKMIILEREIQSLKEQLQKIDSQLSKFEIDKQPNQFNKPITNKINQIVQTVHKIKIDNSIFQKLNSEQQSKISQLKSKIESSDLLFQHKEKELQLVRLQSSQDKQQIKASKRDYVQSLLQKQDQIQKLIQTNIVQKDQNAKLSSQIQQLKLNVAQLQNLNIEEILPMIHTVLGEDLCNLIIDYARSQKQQKYILADEIDSQCSLMAYNKSRQSNVDTLNQELKNRVVETEEQNKILKIKIRNLEKAYQHAIDDYRRSLKFKAICDTTKSKQVRQRRHHSKENMSPNC